MRTEFVAELRQTRSDFRWLLRLIIAGFVGTGAPRPRLTLVPINENAPLPYENATSGKRAVLEMQKILEAFGASSFGCMEYFDQARVVVQFEWRGRQVTLPASAKGYAAIWLRRHPHNNRMRITKNEYERRALQKGQIAVYSMLRDWIKGQVIAIETGMLSFEAAFLPYILLPSGETVLERIERDNVLACRRLLHHIRPGAPDGRAPSATCRSSRCPRLRRFHFVPVQQTLIFLPLDHKLG
jgi:hypothetical protein